MAIEIQEQFEIEAPIDRVWRFVTDPEKVVGCIPGASLTEVVDERNFLGRVKIKLGAVTAAYKGKIHFAEVNDSDRVLRMLAEGKDASGGTAKGEITCSLRALSQSKTEMTTDARIDLTGRVMQVGRGMIKGVSRQLFQQFAKNAKQRLEAEMFDAAGGSADATASAEADDAALAVLPLLLKTLGIAIANFFRRLLGRG